MGYKVPDYALLYAHISIGNIEVLTSDLPSSDSNTVVLESIEDQHKFILPVIDDPKCRIADHHDPTFNSSPCLFLP